ncbi:uncharacterized protein LOC100141760 isoform X7 [Tribolium castaneum]|uniref:uncharacterized protein LOC100141760 isoform X7 n=1 Tax=Tribolium castaneum TaxID=7070 RepID=UPI00046BF244|nr:PREDICTED: uncharacterized protein LOC100141760 isoform X7 [Tribolium castaneum]|eukprot:XP_008197114.1 PREDICTED: uncharacterized protein LOC100141760 isoform X7 [Tribolium castaneum]
MQSKIFQYYSKIRQILAEFLKAKCSTQVEVHLEKWLKHFWQLSDSEKSSTILNVPLFTNWLIQAVTTWEAAQVTPDPTIAWFTLNLATLLSKNEDKFNSLNNHNFFIKLVNIVKARQPDAPPRVKSAYIKLLSTFLEHKPGIEWITACTFWEDIFKLSLSDQSEQIVTESCGFMAKILAKTIDYDENFCSSVINRIMAPLTETIYKSLKYPATTTQFVTPTLKLMGNILGEILDGGGHVRIASLFLKNFHLEDRISDFVIMSKTEGLVLHLSKIMFIMQYFELYFSVHEKKLSYEGIIAAIDSIKKNYLMTISKGSYDEMIEFLCFGSLFWKVIAVKICPDETAILMDHSLHSLCMILMPVSHLLLRSYVPLPELIDRYENDDCRNLFYSKFYKKMDTEFFRIYYLWRDYLMTSPEINHLTIKSLTFVRKARNFVTRDGVLLISNTLMYYFIDITRAIKESPEKLSVDLHADFFPKLLELLVVFIEEFRMSWKDNFDDASLMASTFDFLMLTRWPNAVIVQALKLLNVAVRESMSPNMALLVDETANSTLDLLGPLVSVKLLDVYDVRMAALEVAHTMAQMAGRKFPSLQKVLMDSELPTLVVKMSTCDSESFVRATAIKCLQEMIQVEEIWNNALKSEDLPQKMRDVLLNETEGIVRVEAATFMCVAYENQQFPKDTLDRVYETMIYASTTDLHWEVKVRALDFWDKVIKNHLQNQGMIDGSFPNVTFSKEHRKIVTLTDSEIRKRLLKVLSQLSSIGCLGVLMSAIKDDCDMEVSKTAAKITQRLVELFKKYNVRSDGSTPTSPLPTENGMSTASVSSGISVDESMDSPSNHHELNEDIIDQIVNSKDVCLLRNVYAPSEYSSVSNYDIQVRRVVTPNEFLQFTQQDLNTIISEKKNWLNGIEDLGSLLDDMLKTYEDDVNNMDCY